MILALVNGVRTMPFAGGKGLCPLCRTDTHARCGLLKRHHWAHNSTDDCDTSKESETDWHIDWKMKFPEEFREIIVGHNRADVKVRDRVFEFQHSPISPEDIMAREATYGATNLTWIIDTKPFIHNLADLSTTRHAYTGLRKVNWKYPKLNWQFSDADKYLDFGNGWLGKIKTIERRYIEFRFIKTDEFMSPIVSEAEALHKMKLLYPCLP